MCAIKQAIIEVNLNNIVVIGDFNFVTSLLDRNSGNYTVSDNLYRHEWQKLEVSVGLLDSFRVTNPKRRVYSNTHTNRISRSRIDRIYLST